MNEFENYLIIGIIVILLPFLITIITFPFYLFQIRNNSNKNNKSISKKLSDYCNIELNFRDWSDNYD